MIRRIVFVLAILLFGSLACSVPVSPPTPKPTTVPAKATVTTLPIEIPKTLETLPSYLEYFLPPEAKGNVEVIAPSSISVIFATSEDFMPEISARKYARDFVFAAYGTGLLLENVQIVVLDRNDKVGLSIIVNGRDAMTQPSSTWNDRSIGPSMFIDWVRDQGGRGKSRLSGPWAK